MSDSLDHHDANRIDEIAGEYFDRLAAGEDPDSGAILDAHPSLRERLERRLALTKLLHAAAEEASGFDDGDSARDSADADELPARIDRFEIRALCGRGSFGAVYRAFDPELGRDVAIKVPRAGWFISGDDEQRFEREARSAARLDHPAIVSVHETGRADGVPYLVCEFVNGVTLTEYAREARPAPERAADLMAVIADALAHAHAQGVVHRDIKPANILIDDDGHPHVSDFGLARSDDAGAGVTLEGQLLGTPAYMPPELARGDHANVTSRSDIYSIGVVFYELLTGRRAFEGTRSAVVHQALYDDPPAPRALRPTLPRELETICQKAMAKEPERRYETADALAEDLRRFLRREPIEAMPLGTFGRLQLWARRRPAVASLCAIVSVLLIASAVGAAMAMVEISRSRSEAVRALDQSEQRRVRLYERNSAEAIASGDYSLALPWTTEALKVERLTSSRDTEEINRIRVRAILEQHPALEEIVPFENLVQFVEFSRDGGHAVAGDHGGTVVLFDRHSRERISVGVDGAVRDGMFSAAGDRFLISTTNGRVTVWSATGELIASLKRWSSKSARLDPSGERIVTTRTNGSTVLWNVEETPQELAVFGGPAQIAIFAGDDRLATGELDGVVRLWDAASGELLREFAASRPAEEIIVSPCGRFLVTSEHDKVRAWELATGKRLASYEHEDQVTSIVCGPHGEIVSSGRDGVAILYDVVRGSDRLRLTAGRWLTRAAISPDGARIATADIDGIARVWSALDGSTVSPPLAHNGIVNWVAFSPNGYSLATASFERAMRIWRLVTPSYERLRIHHSRDALRREATIDKMFVAPDGEHVATVGKKDGVTRIWQVDGTLLAALESDARPVLARFAPRTERLCTLHDDGSVRVTALKTLSTRIVPLEADAVDVTFDAAGQLLATATRMSVSLWRIQALETDGIAEPLWRRFQRGGFRRVAFGPDGRVAAARRVNSGILFDAANGVELTRFPSGRHITDFAFDGHDGTLAYSSFDYTVRRLDTSSGEIANVFPHHFMVNSVDAAPDGGRIVSGSYDGTARIWNLRSDPPAEHRVLRRSSDVREARFDVSSRFVVVRDATHSATVWTAGTGERVGPPLGPPGFARRAAFVRGGTALVTQGVRPWLQFWSLDPVSWSLRRLQREAALLAGKRVDDGALRSIDRFELERMLEERGPLAAPPASALAAWHDEWFEHARLGGAHSIALEHLDRRIALEGATPQLYRQRFELNRTLGRLLEAGADFAKAAELSAGIEPPGESSSSETAGDGVRSSDEATR